MRLTGNDPILLTDGFLMRRVETGSVALFCVEVRDGDPVGPRHFLARIGPGEAVFSTSRAPAGLELMIVPVRDATVREIPIEGGDEELTLRLIEKWIELLRGFQESLGEPDAPHDMAGRRQLTLGAGKTLRAARAGVLWVKVLDGSLRYLGLRNSVLAPDTGVFPLNPGAWALATDSSRVKTWGMNDIDPPEIQEGLEALSVSVLGHLAGRHKQEEQADRYRMRERGQLQRQLGDEVLDDLASIVDTAAERSLHGTPLLKAMRVVGDAIGVEIRAPGASEGRTVRSDPVEAIARASRLRMRRVVLTDKWWKWDCGALLAFSFEDGTPVALVDAGGDGYEIVDPSAGTRTKVGPKTAEWLAPEAMVILRPFPEGRLRLIDVIKFSIERRTKDLKFILWAGLVATLLGMVTPQAMAILLDRAIPDADHRLLFEIGAGLLAAAVGMTIFKVTQGIVLLRMGLLSEGEAQAALWDRVLRLRPSFFRGYSSGDLQSRVRVINEIGREIGGATLSTLFSSALAILNLALLFYYSPKLALMALGVGILVMGFTTAVSAFIRKNLRELIEVEGRFFGMVVQIINGVGKLRVAGAAERAYTHWVRGFSEQLRLLAGVYKWQERHAIFNHVLPTLTSALLFLISFEMLTSGGVLGRDGMSLGTFMAFNVALATFLGGITGLSTAFVSFLDVFAKGKRIQPILDAETEVDLSKTDPGPLSGRVELYDVDFSYKEDGPKILDGVHLSAEAGEFIALVGPSGSGKSTLFRVLLGFETPQSGSVLFDGQELDNLDVLAVRRQLGVVLQSGRVDSASIFDNIASGNIITLGDAWAAAEAAGCASEIRDMPMGMHTILSVGGNNLSGGQRQRILIARALAHRPRILLFDEATSALDNRTQAIVSESLSQLQVTRIVVAHRLSTIRNADRIYVMERGRMVQEGTFEGLMAEGQGLFSRMMKRQLA
ncbi:MAG: NHLM bacteriocin system ABC transporter ATP-binding protein [Chlamydiales bacterium]